MAHIIGLDFGNCFSFPCYIPDMDPTANRLAGRPVDLLPNNLSAGIPSVFFYSDAAARRARERGWPSLPWCGEEGTKGRATPAGNRTVNLKRHMGEPLRLDSWEGSYDDAIAQLIQHLVRRANEMLQRDALETSNLLSLAHPATFTRAQCAYLKELAERATLEDGTRVRVVGMIAEPAAAALDYLVENGRAKGETTVLTYDLGGGTFDLAVVTSYPEGRRSSSGQTYYYDIESTGGIEGLGGTDFDEAMLQLLRSKLPAGRAVADDTLRLAAQAMKEELSQDEEADRDLFSTAGELVSLTVSRREFEALAAPLVKRTVDEVRRMLGEVMGKQPELIVLTGGASQMPIVRRSLEEAFPAYRGKVKMFRPSRAIAYGAARFGTPLQADVQPRAPRDIGVAYFEVGSDRRYVDRFIDAVP